MAEPATERRRRRSFLGLVGSAAGGLLLGSASRAEAQAEPGAEFVARNPATSERNVMTQAPGVVPLTVQGGDGKAGLARFFGGDRGNGTRYLTQIGAPGYRGPALLTNTWVTINGQADEPFGIDSVTLVNNTSGGYMLGIASDVGAYPVVVIEGPRGTAPGPFLRCHRYNNPRPVMEVGPHGTIDLAPDRTNVVPITIRPATGGQTVNLTEWRAQDGTRRAAVTKDGHLDLGAVSAPAPATAGRVAGDKLLLYGDSYGLGVQGGRMVAWIGAGARFAVRAAAASGQRSGGPDIITLGTDGDLRTTVPGRGLIVTSPDGRLTRRIGLDDEGALALTPVTAAT